ncbi:hypothetical protein [Spirillospora sp. CA-128828]|uniref:hypothetical protein n=1 Tax=Spirillospora sp. CA-128828 TaxID=3240033 RepID=UPI003D8F214D
MNPLQFPLPLSGIVVKPAKIFQPKNRDYNQVGFMVQIEQGSYFRGEPSMDEDFRAARPKTVYVEGTKEVADVVLAYEGLRLNERIHLRVVEITAFGGTPDDEGKARPPMVKFIVDHIELPARGFRNESVEKMAEKAQKNTPRDATAAAEAKTLAGAKK